MAHSLLQQTDPLTNKDREIDHFHWGVVRRSVAGIPGLPAAVRLFDRRSVDLVSYLHSDSLLLSREKTTAIRTAVESRYCLRINADSHPAGKDTHAN
jgi:hypothetical protein